jgi:hypothetical protein
MLKYSTNNYVVQRTQKEGLLANFDVLTLNKPGLKKIAENLNED